MRARQHLWMLRWYSFSRLTLKDIPLLNAELQTS